MSNQNSSDDEIKLPEDTLKVLNEFLEEREKKQLLEQNAIIQNVDIDFEEDWQLSQFWYNNKTKADLTDICKKVTKDNYSKFKIALLSCPSLYTSIKTIYENVKIFEYDKRFSCYGKDFVFYDFNEAENPEYLISYKNEFDIIIADPPFLSKECVENMSIIIKRITKPSAKILFCSGTTVETFVSQYLQLCTTNYKPGHCRNLGNDFILYTNFEL